MIHDSFTKWHQTPVIVGLNEKPTPVWKIPFPAVTICPHNIDTTKFNIYDVIDIIERDKGISNLTNET